MSSKLFEDASLMVCYAKRPHTKSSWTPEKRFVKKVQAVLTYILWQHKQPTCKHAGTSTMSNNSVSIRSPLSCVRGLHANRCPGLMLTSYSWLAAIKSINENINTDFSASLSPYVRAAQRHHFPSGPCEWTGCSEPARSGSPKFVYRTACAETHRAWGDAGGEANHVAARRAQQILPQPGALGLEWRLGERKETAVNKGLTHGHKNVSPRSGWAQPEFYNVLRCFAAVLLCCAAGVTLVIINKACRDTWRGEMTLYTARSQNSFLMPNTKQNCRGKKGKRFRFILYIYKKGKNMAFDSVENRMPGSPGLQNVRILKCYITQQFLFTHAALTHVLRYSLTTGLFICSFKIVRFILEAVTLSLSASTYFSSWLLKRQTLQVFVGGPSTLACGALHERSNQLLALLLLVPKNSHRPALYGH